MPLELLTTGQAAPLLNRSPRTVARWVKQGRLTPIAILPGPNGPQLLLRTDVLRLAAELAELRVGDA